MSCAALKGRSNNSSTGDDSWSAGRADVAEFLLANGAAVNARADTDMTPLHLAILRNEKEVMDLLLSKGADPDAGNKNGTTPLHLAARKGRRDMVKSLLTRWANVNAKDKRGRTPLDTAKLLRYTKLVALLKQHGAN